LKSLSLAIIIIFIAISCTKAGKRNYPEAAQKRVFEPQSTLEQDEVLTMVKLKTPALFSTAEIVDGKITINSIHLDQLKQEQVDFLAEVEKISPKIEILYRYQYVLNGFTLKTPKNLEEQIQNLSQVELTKHTTMIAPPINELSMQELKVRLNKQLEKIDATSVDFIGATEVHQKYAFTGKGLKVGILDTGIDFTHKMFQGPGSIATFESIDPTTEAPSELYPNAKISGGIDLVGDRYIPGSHNNEVRLPRPDNNPIDISGHGTHVAGTVAGIGDGAISYSGVIPDAQMHAIKVFGGGSTGDFIVLAGFEYAADPNNDNDPSDALDVLNLSLGGAFGIPGNLYDQAITNLSKVGISVVASAGNSGDVSYITGAPATSTDALSVGASIDNMEHNWKFDALSLESTGLPEKVITGFGKASFTKDLSDFTELAGSIVYAGVAAQDFSQELKDKISGKIALIDRGQVSFVDKVKRALDANAIA
jgi:subtilisin family serine protease